MEKGNLKVYILIKDYVPVGHAVNSAAHASLMMYLAFEKRQEVKDWLEHSFKKVTCVVSPEVFEQAKNFEDKVIVTESNFDDEELAMAFCPREEWPEFFKKLKLYH